MKVLLIALGAIVAMGATLAPLAQAQTAPAGQVWNTGKTYHCPGTRWFQNTKTGKLMSEAEATKAGAAPARQKTCAQVAAQKAADQAPATKKGGEKPKA